MTTPVTPTSGSKDVIQPRVIYKTSSHEYHRGTRNGQQVVFKYCTHGPWADFEEAMVESLESMDRGRKAMHESLTRLSDQVGRVDTLTVDTVSNLVNIQNELHELVNLQKAANATNGGLMFLISDLTSQVGELKKTIEALGRGQEQAAKEQQRPELAGPSGKARTPVV